MNLLENVLLKLINYIGDKISSRISIWLNILGSTMFSYFIALQDFISNHSQITIFLLSFSSLSALYFLILHLRTSFKVRINEIYINSKGECFCPWCKEHLQVIKSPDRIHERIFNCKKCEKNISPLNNQGSIICARKFYAFQKNNPLKIFNSN